MELALAKNVRHLMPLTVATNVATPEHGQGTQEYLMYNHKKEEPNQIHRKHGKTPVRSSPPFGTIRLIACHSTTSGMLHY